MYWFSYCPTCNNKIAINKDGLVKCSRCKRCFIVNKKYKQDKIKE